MKARKSFEFVVLLPLYQAAADISLTIFGPLDPALGANALPRRYKFTIPIIAYRCVGVDGLRRFQLRVIACSALRSQSCVFLYLFALLRLRILANISIV